MSLGGAAHDRELAPPQHAIRPHGLLGYRPPTQEVFVASLGRLAECSPGAGYASQASLEQRPNPQEPRTKTNPQGPIRS